MYSATAIAGSTPHRLSGGDGQCRWVGYGRVLLDGPPLPPPSIGVREPRIVATGLGRSTRSLQVVVLEDSHETWKPNLQNVMPCDAGYRA